MSDSQVAGIKAHAEAKNKETIDKVNKAIDKLVRRWQKETDGSVSRLWRTQIWEWATKETVGKEVNVEPLELDKLELVELIDKNLLGGNLCFRRKKLLYLN